MSNSNLSLNRLEEKLAELPDTAGLNGVNYSLSDKNLLLGEYWVPIPSKDPNETSGLGVAVQSVITNANLVKQSETLFIDIAHLQQEHSDFFQVPIRKKSALKSLKEQLGQQIKLHSGKVVIRYLQGDENEASSKRSLEKNIILQDLKEIVDNSYRSDVVLYYGNSTRNVFAPYDQLKDLIETIKDLFGVAANSAPALATSNEEANVTTFHSLISDAFNYITNNYPALKVGWNHAKIFAINGHYGTQGGANFWNEYTLGKKYPADMATQFNGQANRDAQLYLDYLWDRLAKQALISGEACMKYTANGSFMNTTEPAMFADASITDPESGSASVLTANTIGVIDGAYSYGFIQPILDIVTNWMYYQLEKMDNQEVANYLYPVLGYVTNSIMAPGPNALDLAIGQKFTEFRGKIAQFYTGRYIKNYALMNAKSSIKLSQHKLVLDDPAVTEKLPSAFSEGIWPIDLFYSLAIATTNGAEIDMVLSNPGNGGGYTDSVRKYKVLRMIERLGGKPEKVTFKRTSTTEGYSAPSNHSKMVIVDDQIANIGSENFYPSYNQEFSCWMKVGSLISDYWNKFFKSAVLINGENNDFD